MILPYLYFKKLWKRFIKSTKVYKKLLKKYKKMEEQRTKIYSDLYEILMNKESDKAIRLIMEYQMEFSTADMLADIINRDIGHPTGLKNTNGIDENTITIKPKKFSANIRCSDQLLRERDNYKKGNGSKYATIIKALEEYAQGFNGFDLQYRRMGEWAKPIRIKRYSNKNERAEYRTEKYFDSFEEAFSYIIYNEDKG